MTDVQASDSQTQPKTLADHIQATWLENRHCHRCFKNAWMVMPGVVLPIVTADGRGTGNAVHTHALVCQHCGVLEFLSSQVAGLSMPFPDLPKPPKEPSRIIDPSRNPAHETPRPTIDGSGGFFDRPGIIRP